MLLFSKHDGRSSCRRPLSSATKRENFVAWTLLGKTGLRVCL